jgi:hypothetical protein
MVGGVASCHDTLRTFVHQVRWNRLLARSVRHPRSALRGPLGPIAMVICESFWGHFLNVSKALYRYYPDSDIYFVFNWIRQQDLDGQPYNDNFINTIDKEIGREHRKHRFVYLRGSYNYYEPHKYEKVKKQVIDLGMKKPRSS